MEKTTSTLSNFVWKFLFYLLLLFLYVLREVRQNIIDKIMKVCKLHFFVECFAADFVQFPNTTVKACLLSWRLGTDHWFHSFLEFSWNFNFLGSQVLSRSVNREAKHALNFWKKRSTLVSFHMWWAEIELKCEKVYSLHVLLYENFAFTFYFCENVRNSKKTPFSVEVTKGSS